MDAKQASQVTVGLVVVAIGLMLMAGQLDYDWAWDFGRTWPLIFVVIGAGKLLSSESRGSAAWFLFLGGIFLLHTYRILSLGRSWPLFVVVAGIGIMFPKDRRSADGEVKP